MLRWWKALTAGVLILALGAAYVILTRDQSHRQPERGDMEALVGAPLYGPDYHGSSMLQRWVDQMRMWRLYMQLPIPNQMAVSLEGDRWTYTLEVDDDYRPPPDSPLRCQRGAGSITCVGEAPGGWQYFLWTEPGSAEGRFAAHLLP